MTREEKEVAIMQECATLFQMLPKQVQLRAQIVECQMRADEHLTKALAYMHRADMLKEELAKELAK